MSEGKSIGLQLESTRPLSRAERRAQAARIHGEEEPADQTPTPATPPKPQDVTPTPKANPDTTEQQGSSGSVKLKPRRRATKGPFSTQLQVATLARIEWITRRGYVLTDTVDDAINAYLDAANIPRPDENGHMPPS